MKPSNISNVLDLAFRAREKGKIFNPCFVGAPGLGKTEIVQQYAKERNIKTVTLTSAVLEPPDVRGYPSVQTVNGRQRLSFIAPEFWPDSGKGIVILEELNRGTSAIMNAWMALTDARRGFDNYTLPEGWIVCGCINDENEMNDVNTMDTALKDRFEMFHVDYDKKAFVDFMKKEGWDLSVIQFVETGTWTYKLPEDIGNDPGNKYIAPRTISKLNTALEAGIPDEIEMELYTTELGKNVGRAYYHFRHEDMPISYQDLLSDPKRSLKKLKTYSDPKNYKNSHISITVKNIIDNERNTENERITDELLAKVYLALPIDQGNSLITELQYVRTEAGLSGEQGLTLRLAKAYPEIKAALKDVLGNR